MGGHPPKILPLLVQYSFPWVTIPPLQLNTETPFRETEKRESYTQHTQTLDDTPFQPGYCLIKDLKNFEPITTSPWTQCVLGKASKVFEPHRLVPIGHFCFIRLLLKCKPAVSCFFVHLKNPLRCLWCSHTFASSCVVSHSLNSDSVDTDRRVKIPGHSQTFAS